MSDTASQADQAQFLTFKQMCAAIGVSRPTLRKLIAEGRVHATRLSGARTAHYRFALDEPARYLRENRVQPISA
jgi:excisionase family DNA binding protein